MISRNEPVFVGGNVAVDLSEREAGEGLRRKIPVSDRQALAKHSAELVGIQLRVRLPWCTANQQAQAFDGRVRAT